VSSNAARAPEEVYRQLLEITRHDWNRSKAPILGDKAGYHPVVDSGTASRRIA
jgi:hypothetical protein